MEAVNNKYIEHFNKIFKTKIKHIKNIELINVLYEYFVEDLYTQNDEMDEIRDKKIEVLDVLQNTFSEEQKKLFEYYMDLDNEMDSKLEEQLFMFGYIFHSEINREVENIINN